MKRQKGSSRSRIEYRKLSDENDDSNIPMERFQRSPVEPTIEAQIQEGDTLQAIALRFNCTVAELKRLNKIEKEYEIHARKTLKVPITPHTILLENLPGVHRSGQSSPKKDNLANDNNNKPDKNGTVNDLDSKLLLAAAANLSERSINDIILNTEIARNTYADEDSGVDEKSGTQSNSLYDQLLSAELDDTIPQPRPILRRNNDFTCSGSDCDMSWICLFICILALCFAIPLIYVLYIAEHLKEYQHSSSSIETILKNSTEH